jgi:hypothetical protein
MPQPIDGCGIDPIHAAVQAGTNGGDGLLIILLAPSEFPLTSAYRPSSNPNRGNPQVALSERS